MKQVTLVVVFVLASLFCRSQVQLGMGNSIVVLSNDTINPGDSIKIGSYVINKGSAAFTGTLQVTAARDTTNGVTCSIDTISVINLIPGDSVYSYSSFVPTIGITAFKLNGNGNTIVVWPFMSSGTTKDSARVHVLIQDNVGIREFSNPRLKIYPNPALNKITVDTKPGNNFTITRIYDVLGNKVKELDFEKETDVSDLSPGTYLLIVSDRDKKQYRNVFIKE